MAIHKHLLGMSNYGIDKLDKINSKHACTFAGTHMRKYFLLKKDFIILLNSNEYLQIVNIFGGTIWLRY